MEKKRAVYAGSFNPFTNGHLYIYSLAQEIFDVTVLIAQNPKKELTAYQGVSAMRLSIMSTIDSPNVVILNGGLVADYCKDNGIEYCIRGLRNTDDYAYDYAYEEKIAKINAEIYPDLKTIYFRAKDEIISSFMVRLLFENGKDVSEYVSNEVYCAMVSR